MSPPANRSPTRREPGGWLTLDPDEFDYYFATKPPRRGTLLRQLRTDFSSWRGARWPVGGMAILAAGIIVKAPGAVVIGAFMILFYGYMLRSVVRSHSRCEVRLGRVSGLEGRHPVMPWIHLASAALDDGRSIPVTIDEVLIDPILKGHRFAEVVVLHSETVERSTVIGVRPDPKNSVGDTSHAAVTETLPGNASSA